MTVTRAATGVCLSVLCVNTAAIVKEPEWGEVCWRERYELGDSELTTVYSGTEI